MPAVTGLGSGLDIEGLVSGLIAAESTPQLSMFAQRTEKASLLLSGLGEISSVLASLQAATQSLGSADTFTAVTSSSSAPTYATVSAEAGAAAGSYDLEVTTLASYAVVGIRQLCRYDDRDWHRHADHYTGNAHLQRFPRRHHYLRLVRRGQRRICHYCQHCLGKGLAR